MNCRTSGFLVPAADRARPGEGGQALLLALVALALLALVGAAWTALWFRATVLQARTAAARQAFYAAESAIADAERRLPELVAGSATDCTSQSRDGIPVGRATASWEATFCPAGSTPGGLPSVTLTGVGRALLAGQTIRRSVQVRLNLAPVFTRSVYADRALTLSGPAETPLLGCLGAWLEIYGAAYGGSLPSPSGCVTGELPAFPTKLEVPDIPFDRFARVAFGGQQGAPCSAESCALEAGRWYRSEDLSRARTIEVRGPGFVGILGDFPSGAGLQIDPGAVLVVTGNVAIKNVTFLQAGPLGAPGGTGAGLLVAGGNVSISQFTLMSGLPVEDYQANVLALTVPQGCQEPWCVPDRSNRISVSSFSVLSMGGSLTKPRMHLFLYAAPGDGGVRPAISIDTTSIASLFNSTTIYSSAVSAGDVTVSYSGVSFLNPGSALSIVPDTDGMLRFLPLLGEGVWTQVSWGEGP